MSSWMLLRALIGSSTDTDNPLFDRAIRHAPGWYRFARRLAQATGLVLAISALGCYLSVLLTFYFKNALVLIAPVLLGWLLLVAISLGPVVVEERERRTWETLRAVPLPIEALLLGKAGGALWWLRDLTRIMAGLLVVVAIGVGLVSLVLIPNTLGDDGNGLSAMMLCGGVIVLPLASAAVYIFDRAQHFALMAVAALTISAESRSARVAMSGAVVAMLVMWLADAGAAMVVLAVLPREMAGQNDLNLLSLALLGPTVGYLSAFALPYTLLAVSGTLAAREIAVRALWAWAVRAARRM